MYELRRPLSEKNLGRCFQQREHTRPSSTKQLPKNNIEQKENQEIRSNTDAVEYKKLQDKLSYLESKIINIKTNIDNSQRQTKQGLASRFFNQKPVDQPKQKNESDLQFQNKQKSSTLVNDIRPQQLNENLKKPSLSTFVTQYKTEGKETKLVQFFPDTAKSITSKVSFNRKQSNDRPKKETQFLYYISSVIRGYMTPEITKPIQQIRDHLLQSISAAQHIKQITQSYEEKKINLPSITLRKTIIFDLDETLIHCNESTKIPGDIILPIKFPTGELIEASINIRPYAQQVLQTLSRHFELIVFTASHSCYANVVIDYLDPTKQWISHRFYRENCIHTEEGAYVKDLRVIGNRQLSDIVLIDNAAYSFCLQPLNGIPILNFYDNKCDQELLYLQNYLMALKYAKDVRAFNQQYLKLDRFSQYNDPIALLESLFKEYIP